MTVPPFPPPQQPATAPTSGCGCWKIGIAGCAGLIVVGLIAIAVVIGGTIAFVKSTDAYKGAYDRATRDPRVIQQIGAPVEGGWWVMGKVRFDERRGLADLDFPVHGPKGRATIHVVAEREADRWEYTTLDFVQTDGPTIDLLR